MKKKKISGKRRFLRCFLCVIVLIALLSITVLAADADTIKTLKEFDMPKNNIVSYVCRAIGWSMLTGLSYLVNGIETVIYNVNGTIGNFFANAQIQNLNDTVLVILFLLLLLVVLFVGIQFIIQPRQQIAPIITNTIIGIVVLITVPYTISSLYAVTNSAIDLIGQGQQAGMGTQILLDNVTDVLRYDEDNFSTTNLGDNRSWYAENSSDRIVDIDITEMVKPENTSHSEIFGHKVEIAADGTEVLTDISTTSFMWQDIPLLSERYYRWKVDWLVCFVSLIISAIALFLSSIRMAVALYELAVHGMMTEVMALLDVYTHQRMKKCLQLLVTTFASFFGFFLLMQIYLIGMNAISSSSADVFVKIVCMFALGWMVIDGPSIFEKVIGQDLGIRNAARTLVGLRAAGAIAGKGGNLISRGKNAVTGRRTFGGGREGGLRGRIAGDKSRDSSGQVTHTGGLVNRVRSSQNTASSSGSAGRTRRNQQPARASYQSASAYAAGQEVPDTQQDSAAPMDADENSPDTAAPSTHISKYRPEGRVSTPASSPYAPVHTPKYQPTTQAPGNRSTSGGSTYRPVYNAPHMPKYRPAGSTYRPVSGTSYTPEAQPQRSVPAGGSAYQPVSNTPYTPKVQRQEPHPLHSDRLWPEPPAPKISQPVNVPPVSQPVTPKTTGHTHRKE